MSKTCFIVAPIGQADSETRLRSDQVLKHIITPTMERMGYFEVVRADQISEPGLITDQIIQHLISDDLVVADLTGANPNVYYELAVRHAVRKPVIQLIQSGETIPFDVAGIRTIQVDHRNLDSVADCIDRITNQITAIEKDPSQVDSPISVSVELQALRQSENPLEKSNAEMITMLLQIASDVRELSHEKIDIETEFRFSIWLKLAAELNELSKVQSYDYGDQFNQCLETLMLLVSTFRIQQAEKVLTALSHAKWIPF